MLESLDTGGGVGINNLGLKHFSGAKFFGGGP